MALQPAVSIAPRHLLLLWLGASGLAFLLALQHLSATLIGGHFLPADPDSFYHAHRILDAIAAPWSLEQFDPRIHAPEGSWVTWPWGYDMLLATIAHVAVVSFGVSDPMSVLAFVAPVWVFLNAALFAAIAGQLGLSLPVRVGAMLAFALSPLTQALHRVGMLDHHYVEYSFVLATLLCGLRWFDRLEERRRAVWLGLVLGAAPAFHNGLFIIQLPVLLALALRWGLGRTLPRPAAAAFGAALVGGTLLFLLPSEPFRRLMFSFYLQSWFHCYVAACTALYACAFAWFRRSWGALLLLAATGVLLLLPIAQEAVRGGRFITAHLVDLGVIQEAESVFEFLATRDFAFLSENYGALIWLVPLGLAGVAWQLRQRADDSSLFFVVMSVCGAVLMLWQFRLEDYGSFTLVFPWCRLIEAARARWPKWASLLAGGWITAAAAANAPAYEQLTGHMPLGDSPEYELSRPIYAPLAAACARAPGVVLADNDDGHHISFHTKCSVIADNFIMTEQHEQKLLLVQRLLQSSAEQVLAQAPYVRYILVRRGDDVREAPCGADCPQNRGLRAQLLFDTAPLPPRLRLIGEVNLKRGAGVREPLARLFEVLPPDLPAH